MPNCWKEGYSTRAAAEAAIRKTKLKFPLYCYACPMLVGGMQHWHLTKEKQNQGRRRGPLPLTKAEIRHTKNRLADIGRQIEKGFAQLAEERFEEAMRRWRAEQRERWLAEDLAADIERQRTVLKLLGVQ